jgi:hypothetical protein
VFLLKVVGYGVREIMEALPALQNESIKSSEEILSGR